MLAVVHPDRAEPLLTRSTDRSLSLLGMASKVVCPWLLLAVVLAVVAGLTPAEGAATAAGFDDSFVAQWGADGRHLVDQGTEVNLALDQSSGNVLLCTAIDLVMRLVCELYPAMHLILQVPDSGRNPCTGQGSST